MLTSLLICEYQSLYAFATLFFNIAWGCTQAASTAAVGGFGSNTTDTDDIPSASDTPTSSSDDRCATTKASFSFFTVLTYWGLAFYLLVASVHTLTYILSGTGTPLLNRLPRPLQALHALLYTTVTTYPLLVTIVYWAVLYPTSFGEVGGFPNAYAAWSNASQHAMNSVFALFEVLVPRTAPAPPIHLLWVVVLLGLYLALAYVTYAAQGWYVYPFLNPGETSGGSRGVTAYAFGILAAVLVIFGVVWVLIWVRKWVTEEKLGLRGKFAARDEVGSAAAVGTCGGVGEGAEMVKPGLSDPDPETGIPLGSRTVFRDK